MELTGRFFQLGYVTRDLDRAIDLYRTRYGVADFFRFSAADYAPPGTPGPFMEVALAYKGDVMIELIQPAVGDEGIYLDALRADGGVSLHHLGYLVTEEEFAPLGAACRQQGFAVPVEVRAPDAVSLMYVDMRSDNGLFGEFVLENDSLRGFFGQVPHN